ncbi:MAG: hypothetical protein WBM00_04425, partial [Solirubrobacterales bacterium]
MLPGVSLALCGFGSLLFSSISSAAPGAITEFTVPTHISRPFGITAGPDGNVWFTENWPEAHKIGRITPDGQITEFSLSSAANLDSITTGPDGNLWFTDGLSD